jgi:hypothetical protein
MLEERSYRSAVELAEAEGVTRSFVNRLLRLTLLAPDIVLRKLCCFARHTVGLMFWLRRKKFVGSYLFLTSTSLR